MTGFQFQFTARPEDIDELGHVNNAVWVRWVQEVATSHWRALARPEHVEAYFSVVIRHGIAYLRRAGSSRGRVPKHRSS